MNFRFITFAENLLQTVVQNLPAHSLLIFPHAKSKKEAIRLHQANWQGEAQSFLTMEEFKTLCFLPTKPLIDKEKRLLAFYNILSPEDKEFFRVSSYFDTIPWATEFFNFWQELADEQISDINFVQLGLDSDLPENITAWQESIYAKFLLLKTKYAKYLEDRGLTDAIFQYDLADFDPSTLEDFQEIRVVNQFYYSRLEKYLLYYCQDTLKRNINVYFQLPEFFVDKEKLLVTDFNLKNISLDFAALKKIKLQEARDEFMQLHKAVNILQNEENIAVVDNEFYQSALPFMMSTQSINFKQQLLFSSSKLYLFLSIWEKIIANTQHRKVKIKIIYEALISEVFTQYYKINPQVIESIEGYMKKGLQYLVITELKVDLLLAHFENLQAIMSFRQFKGFMDALEMSKLQDENYNKLLYHFYQVLFFLEQTDAQGFIPSGSGTAIFFLQYLLGLLATKKIDYTNCPSEGQDKISIENMADSRNLTFPKLLVLNASEGYMPTPRKMQFLLTEKQRKILGLKNYEDIVLREKYYFYRLILCSRQATILYLKSEEKNINKSSFVEELELAFPSIIEQDTSLSPDCAASYLKSFSHQPFLKKEPAAVPDMMPVSAEELSELKLSFTSFSSLSSCPYQYYLKYIAKLKVLSRESKEELASEVLGVIIHEIFAQLFQEVKKASFRQEESFALYFKQNVASIGQIILGNFKRFADYIPIKYDVYLREVLVALLLESIADFFTLYLDTILNPADIVAVYLEEKVANIPLGDRLTLDARADLILESKNREAYIIDFKTGKTKDPQQLDFYELYYYSLRETKKDIRVKEKVFLSVLGYKLDRYTDSSLGETTILAALESVLELGEYSRTKTKTYCSYCDYKEICRLHV